MKEYTAQDIRKQYKEIRQSLVNLIPEKWEGIYLYASVLNQKGGEMYFYYTPKKFLKHKPINCYEIASRFGIDEIEYNEALEKLYKKIKKLYAMNDRKFSNITIIMENGKFTIEYHYNNIMHSMYTDEQRHLIWYYKNLNIPMDALSEQDKTLIDNYEEESSIKPVIYTEDVDEADSELEIRNQILKY